MTDPRRVIARFGPLSWPGRLLALEGGRGQMRVLLEREGAQPWPQAGQEGELEMHDGARFAVVVTEGQEAAPEGDAEFRMKLLDRGA